MIQPNSKFVIQDTIVQSVVTPKFLVRLDTIHNHRVPQPNQIVTNVHQVGGAQV